MHLSECSCDDSLKSCSTLKIFAVRRLTGAIQSKVLQHFLSMNLITHPRASSLSQFIWQRNERILRDLKCIDWISNRKMNPMSVS